MRLPLRPDPTLRPDFTPYGGCVGGMVGGEEDQAMKWTEAELLLADHIHQHACATHLASTGCRSGHRFTARLMLEDAARQREALERGEGTPFAEVRREP